MRALQRFESIVEQLLEEPFARLFKVPVHPNEIAHCIENEMDARRLVSVDRTYVPNDYRIIVHPSTLEELQPNWSHINIHLVNLVKELAAESDYQLDGGPYLSLAASEKVSRSTVKVEGSFRGRSSPSSRCRLVVNRPSGNKHIQSRRPAPKLVPNSEVTTEAALPYLQLLNADGRDVIANYLLDRSGKAFTIGRDSSNSLSLKSDWVSRFHARIVFRAGNYQLHDSNSRNGTYVNGRRVAEAVLKPGDLISLGEYIVRIILSEQ